MPLVKKRAKKANCGSGATRKLAGFVCVMLDDVEQKK